MSIKETIVIEKGSDDAKKYFAKEAQREVSLLRNKLKEKDKEIYKLHRRIEDSEEISENIINITRNIEKFKKYFAKLNDHEILLDSIGVCIEEIYDSLQNIESCNKAKIVNRKKNR